ncbi:hypothetical protein ACVME5_002945 [Bradyrhizobium liaoningense]
MREGAAADLVILTREGLDEMIGEGRVIAGSAADLARSFVGIAVRAGQAAKRRCAQPCSQRGPSPIRGSGRAACTSPS